MSCHINSSKARITLLTEQKAVVLTCLKGEIEFRQISLPDGYTISEIIRENDHICYTVRCSAADDAIRCIWKFTQDGYPQVILSADPDLPVEGYVKYPPAFDAVPGDVLLLPIGEGMAFPVDDPDITMPSIRALYSGWNNSMDFWAITKGDAWLLGAVESGCDAVMFSDRGRDALYRVQLGWESELGKWGYDRKITYFMGNTGGITAACKAYRAYRAGMGYVVTLREKVKKTPNLRIMPGAANVWLFEDRSLEDKKPSPAKKAENPRDPIRVAEEMKNMGMDRVLWSHAEAKETVAYLRDELGFIPGRYDMYRDIMPPSFKLYVSPDYYHHSNYSHNEAWPDDIIVGRDGEFQKCWPIRCLDGVMRHQNALCDIPAVKWAMTDIPPDMREKGYLCRFVDTTFSVALEECYQPEHPMSRKTCLKYRKILMGYIKDMGIISGTEDGLEAAVPELDYSEGLMSPGYYRSDDAGRKMTTLYQGGQVQDNVKKYMMDGKYRAPLWELVYHDCMTAYWYWGDSSNCCPEYMPRRDLLNALYGTPPLYSLEMSQWDQYKEEIKASYDRATMVARYTSHDEMLSFDYLTEDKTVQKTVFAGGVTVIVNFGETPYPLADGNVVPPLGKVVSGINGR